MRSDTALHDAVMAMPPMSVVSSTSSALNPSMPVWYSAPIDGIHGERVTNWNWSADEGSNCHHSGSDTRKPAHAATLATILMPPSSRRGMASSTSAPTRGVRRISVSDTSHDPSWHRPHAQ
jgi:hypothetical protein